MSGRLANFPHSRRIARIALAFGLFAGCAAMLAAQQPPVEPTNPIGADKLDERSPIPPENNNQAVLAAKLRINKEKAIFFGTRDAKTRVVKGGIEDDRPLASEKQNQDEYQSITEVMLHVAQFSATELAQNGRRDLTPDDLTYGSRFQYRLELIRFQGKVTKARRLQPTKSLEETGFKELFEAWLVPDEESPGYPLCVLLSSWPADFVKLPEIPAGQQAGESVTIDKWAAFGGYSFKLMTYPGQGADPKDPIGAGWLKAPLLIGKSIVPAPEPAAKIELDKSLRIYTGIRDEKAMVQNAEFWEEWSSWNRVVMHSRKFSAQQLEAAGDRKVNLETMLSPHRLDYTLDLVHVQGRLIRLIEEKSPKRLVEAGIPVVYEGWIIPDGEPSGHPINVVMLDLPPGVEPKKTMDHAVTFAGYFFKVRVYESGEKKKDKPDENILKRTPLLIGRSATLRPEPDDATTWWTQGFVPAVVGSVALLGGAALTLGWWFRRGDRAAQAEIESNRQRNPFATD